MNAEPRGALRGAVGAVLWLVGTSLTAPLVDGVPLVGVAQFVIDVSPGAVATTAIETFGKLAQPALGVGVGIGTVALGALLGAYWTQFPGRVRRPSVTVPAALLVTGAVVATKTGAVTVWLVAATVLGATPPVVYGLWLRGTLSLDAGRTGDRRPFLTGVAAGVVSLLGVGAAVQAKSVLFPSESDDDGPEPLPDLDPEAAKQEGTTSAAGTDARVTDTADLVSKRTVGEVTVSTAENGGDFGFSFEGMPKPVTPVGSHYVVDKAIDNPEVDEDGWTLSVDGAVTRPYELAVDDLVGHEDATSRVVTMVCISNEVGGDLISTGRWRGIPLRALVERASPDGEVRDVVTRAADGYHEALPWEYVRDHPEVMIAYGLNGRTLTTAHGDPARLLVPGRYGMRSTKWLTGIELTRGEHDAYWEERGWDEEAVINTLSYLRAAQRRGDRVAVGGVAYAGLRGIQRVEVSFDGSETWQEATLEEPLGDLTWRRFRAVTEHPPGEMTAVVRAVDGTGERQTVVPSRPHPAGSTGWHQQTFEL